MKSPKHYQYQYKIKLTLDERDSGEVTINLDPYRIADIYGIGGGAREQILKKALRWGGKNQTEEEVIGEIINACERRLEMIKEDNYTPVECQPYLTEIKEDFGLKAVEIPPLVSDLSLGMLTALDYAADNNGIPTWAGTNYDIPRQHKEPNDAGIVDHD